MARALPIGGAEDHQPVQRFQFPPAGHEFTGEPVEQLRMGREFAQRAEITRRIDDTPAEMVEPKAVHQNACDQGVFTTGQPLQKKEIVTSLSKVADVFLSIESHDQDAKSLLTILPLAGICLKGSPETKVGLKDYNFADLLESLDTD